MNTTDRFLEGVIEKLAAPLPEAVVHQVRRCMLDYLGATLAGARMLGQRGLQLIDNLDFTPPIQIVGFR